MTTLEIPSSPTTSLNSLLSNLSEDFWQIPNEQWGDIMCQKSSLRLVSEGLHDTHDTCDTHNMCEEQQSADVARASSGTPEKDALEDWTPPNLRLRKHIWENFPVSLVSLNDKDGTDRYAIMWQKRNLEEWKDTRSESYAEWLDYQDFCEIRLLHALQLQARYYVVEPARNENQICVIAMVHGSDCDSESGRSSVSTTSSKAGLRNIGDIARNFPVRWDQDGKVLRFEFMRIKMKDATESPAVIRDALIQALKESSSWTMTPLPAGSPYLCAITLN